jgi:DNA-directed RNA polymerase specialized sigma24 family protein
MRAVPPTPDTLIDTHLPLVTHAVAGITSRIPSSVAIGDLVAAAVEGLCRAAAQFTGDTPFAAVANSSIRSALLAELRGERRPAAASVTAATLARLTEDAERATAVHCSAVVLGGLAAGAGDMPTSEPDPVAKRKAGAYAALGAASEYRSRAAAGDVAERVALAGLGG